VEARFIGHPLFDRPAPETEAEADADLPSWDDDYLQNVAERLKFNYDLQRDYAVRGQGFEMYGRLYVRSQKQFLHQSLNWANYETVEWIEPDEEHQGTDFTFVLVVPRIPEAVATHVNGFRDRTLLKYGYYGAYEVNLVVVAPDAEDAVGSSEADVTAAFELWRDLDAEPDGLLGRLRDLFR